MSSLRPCFYEIMTTLPFSVSFNSFLYLCFSRSWRRFSEWQFFNSDSSLVCLFGANSFSVFEFSLIVTSPVVNVPIFNMLLDSCPMLSSEPPEPFRAAMWIPPRICDLSLCSDWFESSVSALLSGTKELLVCVPSSVDDGLSFVQKFLNGILYKPKE